MTVIKQIWIQFTLILVHGIIEMMKIDLEWIKGTLWIVYIYEDSRSDAERM